MSTNVPWIGPRSRYSVLNMNSSWVIQKMDSGCDFTGDLPAVNPPQTPKDPVVSAGLATWSDLAFGGLFNWLDRRHAIVVENFYEILNSSTITAEVHRAGGYIEAFPALPFVLGPADYIVVTSAGSGEGNTEFGILARIEGTEIL